MSGSAGAQDTQDRQAGLPKASFRTWEGITAIRPGRTATATARPAGRQRSRGAGGTHAQAAESVLDVRAARSAKSAPQISPARTAVVDSRVDARPWVCSVPPWRQTAAVSRPWTRRRPVWRPRWRCSPVRQFARQPAVLGASFGCEDALDESDAEQMGGRQRGAFARPGAVPETEGEPDVDDGEHAEPQHQTSGIPLDDSLIDGQSE